MGAAGGVWCRWPSAGWAGSSVDPRATPGVIALTRNSGGPGGGLACRIHLAGEGGCRSPTTAEITRSLTQAVTSFRDENVLGPIAKYARAYRELRLPVVPDGKGRFGRLDVVVWLPGVPDLAVGIDSRPNVSSAQKLTFARDAGACPLWVRFGTGGIEKIDGVTVLDIREAVQGVLDAGAS